MGSLGFFSGFLGSPLYSLSLSFFLFWVFIYFLLAFLFLYLELVSQARKEKGVCGILGLTVYDRVDIYRISTGRVFDRILPSRTSARRCERCHSLNTTYSELSVCPSPTFFVTPVPLLSEAKEDHSTSTCRVGGVRVCL
jgi:hypothetical protein